MNGKMAAGVAATATAAVVAGLFATSGTASAAASLDLNYSCTFPLIDVQPVKVH
ncbi:hypothetical protein GPZ80_31850, partial [Actinokineospora sp. HBU206404]|nr:hypothetical protein [Actinokineospora xionganensis]